MGRRKLAQVHEAVERLHQALVSLDFSKHRAYHQMAAILEVSPSTIARELEPLYRDRLREYEARPEVKARRRARLCKLRTRPDARERHNRYARRYSSMAYHFQDYLSEFLLAYNKDEVADSEIGDWFEEKLGIRPQDSTIRKHLQRYAASGRAPRLSAYSSGQYRLLTEDPPR